MAEGKKEGRQALLWLNRGLAFTKSALRRMQAESELKMPEAFKKAYDGTLATYHGWIVKKTVNVRAFPRSRVSRQRRKKNSKLTITIESKARLGNVPGKG